MLVRQYYSFTSNWDTRSLSERIMFTFTLFASFMIDPHFFAVMCYGKCEYYLKLIIVNQSFKHTYKHSLIRPMQLALPMHKTELAVADNCEAAERIASNISRKTTAKGHSTSLRSVENAVWRIVSPENRHTSIDSALSIVDYRSQPANGNCAGSKYALRTILCIAD